MMSAACHGCGGMYDDPPEGGAHASRRASSGCCAAYDRLLARLYSERRLVELRQLPVDVYAVQHPAAHGRIADQSLALHLRTLGLFVEHGVDPARGPQLHKQMVAGQPSFPALDPPARRGRLTLADVPLDGEQDAVTDAVWRWAATAWDAWAAHHADVHDWLEGTGCAVMHHG